MLKRRFLFLAAVLAAVSFAGVRLAEGTVSCMGPLVEPTLIEQANFKPCEPAYKFDSTPKYDEEGKLIVPGIPMVGGTATFTWEDVPSCDGMTSGPVTVTLKIVGTSAGQVVSFEVIGGVTNKVYVKGGPGGNLYNYCCPMDEACGVASDCGLHAPVNPNNNEYYGVSHVDFCLCYVPEERCYEDETAWGAGLRYVDRGNWATYTPYFGEELTVTLFAGQTYEAGVVNFSAPVGGLVTITIVLNSGFEFNLEEIEPVKVQDCDIAPSGNPAPGLFDWKDAEILDNIAVIVVPENNFYGVHVDVLREVDCYE
jgi:hypothetical protein